MAMPNEPDKLTESLTIRISSTVFTWLVRKAAAEHRSMSRTAAMLLQAAHDADTNNERGRK